MGKKRYFLDLRIVAATNSRSIILSQTKSTLAETPPTASKDLRGGAGRTGRIGRTLNLGVFAMFGVPPSTANQVLRRGYWGEQLFPPSTADQVLRRGNGGKLGNLVGLSTRGRIRRRRRFT